jgi:hypothetical protein
MTIEQLRKALADTDQIVEYDSEELLDAWVKIDEEHAADGLVLNKLHYVLAKRMEDRGATALPHPTHDASYKSRSNKYDHEQFTPILELIPLETLVADGAYTAPWEETVVVEHEAVWDTRKAQALKKYDPTVTAIIEKAKTPADKTLVIKAREKSK